MSNDQSDETKDNPIPLSSSDTFIMSNKTLRHMVQSIHPEEDGDAPKREIILVIRNMQERLPITDDLSVILGRSDLKSGYRPDVDLTPYGAQNRGVSRQHARLHIQDQELFVTDLGSPNGTFVSGERLPPNEPHHIRKGDNLMLGSLVMQVHF
jgi:hypothetical protein